MKQNNTGRNMARFEKRDRDSVTKPDRLDRNVLKMSSRGGVIGTVCGHVSIFGSTEVKLLVNFT